MKSTFGQESDESSWLAAKDAKRGGEGIIKLTNAEPLVRGRESNTAVLQGRRKRDFCRTKRETLKGNRRSGCTQISYSTTTKNIQEKKELKGYHLEYPNFKTKATRELSEINLNLCEKQEGGWGNFINIGGGGGGDLKKDFLLKRNNSILFKAGTAGFFGRPYFLGKMKEINKKAEI